MLKKIHAEKPHKDAATAMLKKFVAAMDERFGNQQHQQFFDALNATNAHLIAGIMQMATPKQQQHFVQGLQDWVNDFNKLAAKAA